MIIWINGPFGSGKTQTAYELHRRIPHSFVYDPEQAGYFIRRNLPRNEAVEDFQDYPMWRDINYRMLKYITSSYTGIVIVPMTVVNPVYFQEIAGRLQEDGVLLRHFTLWASKETILKRLRSRLESRRSWAARQVDRCLDGLSDDTFQHHLDTENMSVATVAETIAALLQIELLPDDRSLFMKAADRLSTQLRHIRLPWQG